MPKTRKDFQRLADLRTKEAELLARGGKQQGAHYLGGFAIECALKACIAKKTRRYDFPDQKFAARIHSHDLGELLKIAGLQPQLEKELKGNPHFAANWGVVSLWRIEDRYETTGLGGRDMVSAITAPKDGVLQWIRLFW
jgi:hypothetical protein